jgi:hypothetical protein
MEDEEHLLIKPPLDFNLPDTQIRMGVLKGPRIRMVASKASKCLCKKFSRSCLLNSNLE